MQKNHESHVLWTAKDEMCPPGVLDRNGDVALALCRLCGKGEAELVEPCKVEGPTQKSINDEYFEGCEVVELGWQAVAPTLPERMSEEDKELMRAVFYSGAFYAVAYPDRYALCHADMKRYSKRFLFGL